MSSQPSSSRQRVYGSIVKPITSDRAEIVCCSRSTVTSAPGSFSSSFHSSSTSSWVTSAASNPPFPEFPRKMSANLGEMTTLMP